MCSHAEGQDAIERVEREFHIRVTPGEDGVSNTGYTLRPDLAVITRDKVIVIEVSVVYEPNSLEIIRHRKLDKYKPLRKVLQARFNRSVRINTLIVGCRGGWIKSNNAVLRWTGATLTEQDKNCLVERAVRGSLITYARFVNRTYEPLIRYVRRANSNATL